MGLMLLSWSSFSQSVTNQDSIVIIPKTVATEIAKDLIRLDKADSINTILNRQLELETRKVTLKDQMISNLEDIVANQKEQLSNSSKIITTTAEERDVWKKKARKATRRLVLVSVGSTALIVLILL